MRSLLSMLGDIDEPYLRSSALGYKAQICLIRISSLVYIETHCNVLGKFGKNLKILVLILGFRFFSVS